MPLTSAFTRFGMLAFSSQPSHAQRIYEALVRAMGDGENYALDFDDNYHSAKLYAMAMGLASIQYTLERAGNNRDPLKATEMLGVLEEEYRITPSPTATLPERRAVLAAKILITRGARRENIENALKLILGSYFVAYHPMDESDFALPEDAASPWPLSSSDGTFKDPATIGKLRTIDGAVSSTGLQWVYTYYLAGDTDMPLVGDIITVEPEICGQTESVTVEGVSASVLQATFTKSHDPGAVITTAPYPLWASVYRHNLVVLDTTAFDDTGTTLAGDPYRKLNAELQRQVKELLEQALRCVSTYLITEESSTGVAGPFTVGNGAAPLTDGLIGITPIGSTTL